MHLLRTSRLPLIPWLLCAVACASPTSTPDDPAAEASQASPLLGAPEDHEHRYDVGICRQAPNQDPALGEIGACLGRRPTTGTLVAPNLVLLGRGSIDRATFPAGEPFCHGTFTRTPPAVLKVTLSDSAIRGNPVWLDVEQVLYPPTDRFCDDGLALLVLANNVPMATTRPIDIDVRRDVAVHPPRGLTLIGRGSVALHVDPVTFAITEDTGGYTRRILKNVPFVCASNTDEGCSIVDITSDLPNNLFNMPKSLMLIGPGLALGDGNFIDQSSFDRGRPKVVAVGTFIPIGENGDPNGSIGVRTSVHREFLVRSARAAAEKGHYPVPRWARGCDADDSD
ncbi:hypothetical protein LZC95_02545 [Pendulispora brunnea]|uniref:Uncharacterized protein n=1 Tax=Pendulispora brunnea TaxID=2905690 RepID=A0ABZ2KF57_9BACT